MTGRTVADLETTALAGIKSWARRDEEAAVAAVRGLARRAEQAGAQKVRADNHERRANHYADQANEQRQRAEAAEADREKHEADRWHTRAALMESDRDRLADTLREIRDAIVPYPYSPQFLKDIARAALDRQEAKDV